AMAARAMLMPPEAEPVMPASTVTLIATLISGLGIACNELATTAKPGSSAMMPPKPYSDAVLSDASSAPATAALLPSANLASTGRQANANTVRMPSSSAPSTAQMAATELICVMIGLAPRPMVCCSPYTRGMRWVSQKLATPTITRGEIAIQGLGSFSASYG